MAEDRPKVISLFAEREKLAEEEARMQAKKDAGGFDFAEQMEYNKRLKERKEKERLDANKSVLRSYRIKH